MRKRILQMRLAWRMLSKRKGYSAATVIAVVAILGVAIATTATVCVESVFNGFQKVLTENLNRLAPDVEITPAQGKVFSQDAESLKREVAEDSEVAGVMAVMSDNALVLYGTREMPITLRGVEQKYVSGNEALDSMMIAGKKSDYIVNPDGLPTALLSVGAASQLSFYTLGDRMLLFAPRREGRINMSNPVASFVSDSIAGVAVFESRQSEIDDNTIFCDIEVARKLFSREGKASALNVTVKNDKDISKVADNLRDKLGGEYVVKDRFQQAEINFRMVKIEKWISFLLLSFILIIASFNIVSTLSIIVLDKNSSIKALHSLGMSKSEIGGVFFWESIFISIIGGVTGLLLGSALCLLQEKYGFIKIAGENTNVMLQAYPVELQGWDLLITMVPIIIVGIAVGWISSIFAKSRT